MSDHTPETIGFVSAWNYAVERGVAATPANRNEMYERFAAFMAGFIVEKVAGSDD